MKKQLTLAVLTAILGLNLTGCKKKEEPTATPPIGSGAPNGRHGTTPDANGGSLETPRNSASGAAATSKPMMATTQATTKP